MKLRQILTHHSFLTLLSTIIFVGLWGFWITTVVTQSKYLEQLWQEDLDTVENRAASLFSLVGSIGYGGMIHNFKNYVLRHTPETKMDAQEALERAYAALDDLEVMLSTPEEFRATFAIRQTLQEYQRKLVSAQRLIAEGANPRTIDEQIRVDDAAALAALQRLIEKTGTTKIATTNIAKAESINLASLAYLGLAFLIPVALGGVLVSVLLARQKRLTEEARIISEDAFRLLNASMDAVLAVEKSGNIDFANLTACKLTQYSRRELQGMNVDNLLPTAFRDSHGLQREAFFDAPEEKAMGAGRTLTLLTKAGEEKQVKISLSPIRKDGRLQVVASMVEGQIKDQD